MSNDLKDRKGVSVFSRREFLKLCGAVAASLGLSQSAVGDVARVLTTRSRPPVLWIHFSECTGCSCSVLRTVSPWFDELIMNSISLDYHETLMAASGEPAHQILLNAADQYNGEFICVAEGAIPTADGGIYGQVGGMTMYNLATKILPKAKFIIAVGTCASFGGIAAAEPNPTGARSVDTAFRGIVSPVIKVAGCPPNPVNVVAVITDYLLHGTLPELDSLKRPKFAYGTTIHELCPYKSVDLSYRCLSAQGCKGPQSYNNCPSIQFNDGTSFPMKAGHPCIGCSEPNFWDEMSPFKS